MKLDLSDIGDSIAKRHLLRSYIVSTRNNRGSPFLNRRHYRIFLMRWNGYTYKEIGKTIGVTGGRVQQLFKNVNRDLRRHLRQTNESIKIFGKKK